MKHLRSVSSLPLMVNPNAGLPRSENGRTVYDIDACGFAQAMKAMAECGVSVLGGLLGPRRSISGDLERSAVRFLCFRWKKKDRTVVSSYGQAVILGERPVIIGERINPTENPGLSRP